MSKDAFPLRIQESERDIGEKKKADLSELWVYKFRCLGQLYLLGYPFQNFIANGMSVRIVEILEVINVQ